MSTAQKHISLLALNRLVQDALVSYMEPAYWVVAEIGEIRVHQRGHCYLELVQKDDTKLLAKTRATIWSTTYKVISRQFLSETQTSLKAGLQVLVQLSVEYHELYGLSLNIKEIDGKYTLGERARKHAEVISRLTSEGLLNKNKQFTLDVVPQRLAVITSASAAGYEDFKHQLESNPYGYRFQLSLFEASMQGDRATQSMIQAIEKVDPNNFDAIILIRGGGARTDLDCFDEYQLAAALATAPMPVITGIGHERDNTVADLVAHTVLKTPTAVAEFILNRATRFEGYLIDSLDKISRAATRFIQRERQQVDSAAYSIQRRSITYLLKEDQKIIKLSQAITSVAKGQIKFSRIELNNLRRILVSASNNILCQQQAKLDSLICSIDLQDPEKLLEKGYTITLNAAGKRLKKMPVVGDTIITRAKGFKFTSTVTD